MSASVPKRSLAVAQNWTKKRVLEPLDHAVKVLTGRAAQDEIKTYILDNEAVHTALVTRLLHAETRLRRLTAGFAILAVVELARWFVR